MPKIIVQRGDDVREIELAKETFSIGRTPENDLELKDSLISRRHSSIVRRGEEFHVYDLGSSNGTYVNQEKIEVRILKDGDMIRLGETQITFRDENNPREAPHKELLAAAAAVPMSGFQEPTMRIQHVSEIAESFQLDFTDAFEKGMSIVDARPSKSPEEKVPESNLFHILYLVCKELSRTSSVQALFESSMGQIFKVINCERGVLLTFQEGTLSPRFAYHREKGVITGGEMSLSSTILNKVINEKAVVATDDAQHDDRFLEGMSIVQFNIRSVVAAPLWEGEGVFGAIYLDNFAKTHAFTEDDENLLAAIGNLVAVRMKQEELNEKLRQEMMVRDNLSKYHSPDVVEMIMLRGGSVGLEVEEREVTVLFRRRRRFDEAGGGEEAGGDGHASERILRNGYRGDLLPQGEREQFHRRRGHGDFQRAHGPGEPLPRRRPGGGRHPETGGRIQHPRTRQPLQHPDRDQFREGARGKHRRPGPSPVHRHWRHRQRREAALRLP